jgi:lipopolysaccharide export system ATP-binding protein
MTNKVSANNLYKIYNGRKVVDGVSLDVKQGEIVGLLGTNGAGKTTTFYMIVGIINPLSGNITYNNKDITKLPMYKRADLGIGYLAQEPSIFKNLTVLENIQLAAELKSNDPKKIKSVTDLMLEEFKVTKIANTKGYALSGGERRRVEMARAIALEPKFMLLDEPFAGVDPIAVEDIQSIVRYLKSRGLGILITDHNVRETLSITDRAYIMSEGKVIASGTTEEISKNKLAKKVYLGDRFELYR